MISPGVGIDEELKALFKQQINQPCIGSKHTS